MSDLAFGIEIVIVGFLVVLITLLLLAFILMGFNKVLAPRTKKTKDSSLPGQEAAPARDKPEKETATLVSTAEEKEGAIRPEVAAAAMGALMYALGTGSHSGFRIKQVRPLEPARNLWAQSGRTRAVQTRQDFVLFRKGKFR